MERSKVKPPVLANHLLKLFCRQDYLEEVKGDLNEVFEWRVEKKGALRAKTRYYLDAFSAIRLMKMKDIRDTRLSRGMLYSFAKSSFRNFNRNRAYTFLNVFGLAIGMAAALFILEYVSDELNYDQFSQSDQMYRISQNFVKNNELLYETAVTGGPVAPAILRDLPQVEKVGRLVDYTRIWTGKNVFLNPRDHEKRFHEPHAYFADPTMVDLFDLKLVVGSDRLDEPNTVLLSTETADKYFGSGEMAVGKVIKFVSARNKPDLLVTGVYETPKFNMQIRPSALISYASMVDNFGEVGPHEMWGVNSSLTYVKLKENLDLSEFESLLADLLLKYNPIETPRQKNAFRIGELQVMPIKDIHLQSTYQDEVGPVGNATTIKTLIVIALFIVIIAWVNYVNLATAHSLNRLKELGVRKVMGAKKMEIGAQFFVEALLMNVFALLLAVGIVIFGQEFFNYQVAKSLSLEVVDWIRFGGYASLFFCLGVLLSGLYPLTVFFSLGTITVLKGKAQGTAGGWLRKGLIVFQFLASALLIIATLSIRGQLYFMASKDQGINIERVLVIDGPTVVGDQEEHRQKARLLVTQLQQISNVLDAGVSNNIPGKPILQSQPISRESNKESAAGQYELVTGSEYLKILNARFIAGKSFDQEQEEGRTPQIILSESALYKMGFANAEEAIGQPVYRGARGVDPLPAIVVGVIEDYHHEALKHEIDPMVFYASNNWDYHYLIKLKSDESVHTLSEIEKIYQSIFPESPANYYFLDDFFARQYSNEEVNGKVFASFATIGISVACMGLFGLSSFVALQRTKEIGIRKVLGAGVNTVFFLLSKELILLALLGFLLSVPLGYFGISKWLEGFAYHISISPWLFLIPFMAVIVLSLIAISPKVIKTALMNPVKSLRHE